MRNWSIDVKFVIAFLLSIVPMLAHAGRHESFDWLFAYDGRSTNSLIWDKRAEPMITRRVPAALSKNLLDALGGPPDPVYVVGHRFVSMSACASHYCPMKGFFWIDTQTGLGLGAVWGSEFYAGHKLQIASNAIPSNGIPLEARNALIDWLTENDLRPSQVVFSGRVGGWKTLDPSGFSPRPRYVPAAGGPSFDCRNANGVIATTICHDPQLSKSDLDLYQLADSIRKGSDELAAMKELTELQERWARQRDAECASVSDVKACLEASYRAQHEKLMNWIPYQPPNKPRPPVPDGAGKHRH